MKFEGRRDGPRISLYTNSFRDFTLALSFLLAAVYDLSDFNDLYLCWILHNQSCTSQHNNFFKAIGKELPEILGSLKQLPFKGAQA